MALAGAVLQPEVEAGAGAQFGDGGGLSAKMKASRMLDSAMKARPEIAAAECSAPERSLQSFRITKARPAFCPWPEKEKPATVTMFSTSGCLSMKSSTWCSTSLVRDCAAPAGNWMLVMM